MTQLAQCGTVVEGNISSSTIKKKNGDNKERNWFFTWNNYERKDITLLLDIAKSTKCRYCFQEEIGSEGTEHLQGILLFKNARSFNSMKKIDKRVYWKKLVSVKAGLAYCSKTATRNGEIFTNMIIRKKIKDPLLGLILRDFQDEILGIISENPDDRTIHWYWDAVGNIGKTCLAKHICMNYNALYLSGKASDMKYAISEYMKKKDLDIVLLDFTRSSESYVSYEGIESIKNGIFFSSKYEGNMCIFNCPHVIVFSNFAPVEEKLSIDRWKITDLSVISD